MGGRILYAARLAWAAYTSRRWAVAADIVIVAAIAAGIAWRMVF